MSEELSTICPKCGSFQIEVEQQSEYTGGGFSDYWDEYYCTECNYEWRSEKHSNFM